MTNGSPTTRVISLTPSSLVPSIQSTKLTEPIKSIGLTNTGVECPVCLIETVRREDLLECGHGVCKDCIECLTKPTCPMCRADLKGPLVTADIQKKLYGSEEDQKEIQKIRKQIQTEISGYFLSLFHEIMLQFYNSGVLNRRVETPIQGILDALSEDRVIDLLVGDPESEHSLQTAQVTTYLLWRTFVNHLGRPSYYSNENLQMVNLLAVLDDVIESIQTDPIYINIVEGMEEILGDLHQKYLSFGLNRLV